MSAYSEEDGVLPLLHDVHALQIHAAHLDACAASSAGGGGIDALPWEDALTALDVLRQAVVTLQQIDAALVRRLYMAAPHGQTEVAGIGVIDIRRANDRKAWIHESWQADVRAAILDRAGISDEVFTASGESFDIYELLRAVEAVHGATAPKVTALRALGLDDAAYCEVRPGAPQVQITRNGTSP